MASTMIGRSACPECGFAAAHVKQSEKCLYRYCPECQSQHHARTERQRADLMAKTRPLDATATPTPTPSEPAAEPTATPTPTAAAPKPSEPTATPAATPAPAPAAPAPRKRLFG